MNIKQRKIKIKPRIKLNYNIHQVVTFNSIDKILWCDHSNETSLPVLLHDIICFSIFFSISQNKILDFS